MMKEDYMLPAMLAGGDLLHIAQEIKPEILIPVHSEQPDFYVDHLEDRGIRITLPVIGEPIKI